MAPTVVHCRTMRDAPSMPCLAAPVPAAAVAAAATAACSQDGTKRMQRGPTRGTSRGAPIPLLLQSFGCLFVVSVVTLMSLLAVCVWCTLQA